MSSEEEQQTYLVDAYSDPICIKIQGRASYLNSGPLSRFFPTMIKRGKKNFLVDFADCEGMDSTFLGIIAGVALELKKPEISGNIHLCNVETRNLELIENLGLHRILGVNTDFCMHPHASGKANKTMDIIEGSPAVDPKNILAAHESLVSADTANLDKFQDVISFLRKQTSEENDSIQ